MRFLHPAALLLSVGALALAGCGGSDGDEAASTTPATTDDAPAATTQAAPATTATVETTVTTTPTVTATTPGGGATTSTEPSGGTAPPADDAGSTTSGGTAPSVDTGGDQPTITVNGSTARAIADDPSVAEIWCDAARGGAYASQLADATVLQITVRGSDDVQRCELPR